jgi:hypothetical protein
MSKVRPWVLRREADSQGEGAAGNLGQNAGEVKNDLERITGGGDVCLSARSHLSLRAYPRTGRRRLEAARWRLSNAAGRRVYGFANAARSPITDEQRNALAQSIAAENIRLQRIPTNSSA